MKKLALVVASLIALTSVAHADWEGRRRYGGYHRGGGSDWVAPLLGGVIIGGMIAAAQQPRVYGQPVYEAYEPQLVCYPRFVGRDYFGTAIYERVCEYR